MDDFAIVAAAKFLHNIIVLIALVLFSISKAVGMGSKIGGALFEIISSVFLSALVFAFVSAGGYILSPVHVLLIVFIFASGVVTIARAGKGKTVTPPGAKILERYCTIEIICEKTPSGTPLTYNILLNNKFVGKLQTGKSLAVKTKFDLNTLVMEAKDDPEQNVDPLHFSVEPGGTAEIYFGPGKYLQSKCSGCQIL